MQVTFLNNIPKNINLSIIKQRYNTFHLKTDGADPLSIITCIDACLKKLEKHSRSLDNLKQLKNGLLIY